MGLIFFAADPKVIEVLKKTEELTNKTKHDQVALNRLLLLPEEIERQGRNEDFEILWNKKYSLRIAVLSEKVVSRVCTHHNESVVHCFTPKNPRLKIRALKKAGLWLF